MKALLLGTRGSPLALAQTEIVRQRLEAAHPNLTIEVRIIKTRGDLWGDVSLLRAGGKGLFTREIEDELVAGAIHVAVHSLKDLPTRLPEGLCIGATLPREDPRDVLIAKRAACIADLPPHARVATSSLRRRAQLLAQRPDLQVEEIRGNIGTRLRKFGERDDLDAMVLAAAGLKRLGLLDGRWPMLEVTEMIPAVGQGIIACEARAGDAATLALLQSINDSDTFACGEAERAFLHAAGGGCQLPYAAHATVRSGQLHLIAARFAPDGTNASKTEVIGSLADAIALGKEAAGLCSASVSSIG